MYFNKSEDDAPLNIENSNKFVIIISTILILAIGIFPSFVSEIFKF
jgi:NADH:ubiquinone oxidoreductase subunit 2 (subunit N)